MRVIAICNQKGGVGKSTTSVHLAHWLSRRGSVVLVDADLQQSGTTWLKQSQLKIENRAILDPEEMFSTLRELKNQYDYVVIDGPAGLSELIKTILDCVDLVLVPIRPGGLDLISTDKMLTIIQHRQMVRDGKPTAKLFLNQAVKNTVLLKETQQLLSRVDFPLMKTIVYQRQCVADAPVQGVTVFLMSGASALSAAKDYDQLFQEVLEVG